MTEKEKNLAICRKLEEVAVRVWEQVKATFEEGSYTASQVDKEGTYGNLDMAMSKVQVGDFKCRFPDCHVFYLLHKFYAIAGVKSEDRKRFTYINEKEDVVLNAVARVEKRHQTLKNMVVDDDLRPTMKYLYLDAEKRYLVASDGHILGAMRIDMTMNIGKEDGNGFLIGVDAIEKPDNIDVSSNKDGSCTYYGNIVEGVVNETRGYPNWRIVIPSCSDQLHMQLTADSRKNLMGYLRSIVKMQGNCVTINKNKHRLSVYYRSYERVLHVVYRNEDCNIHNECSVELCGHMEASFQFGICAEYLLMLEKVWNGSMWFRDPTTAIVFDSDLEDTFMIMPMLMPGDEHYVETNLDGIKYNLRWEERYNNKNNKKEMKKEEKEKKAETPLRIVKQEEPAKQEASVQIERTTTMVGRRFFPLLIMRDGVNEVVVSGNSLYGSISDENGNLIPMYQELLDRIDAFVDDELLTAETLDEGAICTAVNEFMDMVESVSVN